MGQPARKVTDANPEPAAVPPTEERLLEDVFLRHQNELLGTLYHLVGNADDARDALQEAFIKCWQHRQEIARIGSLKAWVFQVALNTARDLRKTAWRRKRQSFADRQEESLEARVENPADETERSDEVDRIRQAVMLLRPEEKEVFLLRENGEMTYEQIGASLGLPVGTVKTRMRAALGRLRGLLGGATA